MNSQAAPVDAAIGVILYFVGAIISHIRVKEGFSAR